MDLDSVNGVTLEFNLKKHFDNEEFKKIDSCLKIEFHQCFMTRIRFSDFQFLFHFMKRIETFLTGRSSNVPFTFELIGLIVPNKLKSNFKAYEGDGKT